MSLTKVSYSMISGIVFNALDFGAIGDGVANDTAAIQAAVNASTGNTLYIPAGTYLVSSSINLKSNLNIIGTKNNTVIKIANGTYGAATQVFVSTPADGAGAKTNVTLSNLVIDGNKGNIGTSRNPIITWFEGSNYTISNCRFQNCEGICLNISTVSENVTIENVEFINCGGAPDNSDGYRKQAIAFSNTTGGSETRTKNVFITNCLFDTQGLDCISLGNCDEIVVSSNIAKDSYSFLYTAANPYSNNNLVVSNNAIYNTNQGAYVSTTQPLAIDLPDLTNGSIVNNVISSCAQSGIGVFSSSKNVVVSGNSLLDVCTTANSWVGGISIGGDAVTGYPDNITVAGNIVENTLGGTTMIYGLFINTNSTNVFISNNTFTGATTSKFGYYVTGLPSVGNSFPLTTNSPLDATICIVDADPANGVITNWRKHDTLTSYSVNGTKVVGVQQAAIPNSGDATVNSILAALRTHGLIAT
jgi:hypothetical protein